MKNYPATHTSNHLDTYHGVQVADPYRWLESEVDPERSRWIVAQNEVSRAYLDLLPERLRLLHRFGELLQYTRWYNFYRRGPFLLYQRNEGLTEQLVLCAQVGLPGTPDVVVDPRLWDPDGRVRVVSFSLSSDCRYLAHALSHAGSDWQEIRVLDMHTRTHLKDQVRMFGAPAAWRGHGFYYSRYPDREALQVSAVAPREGHQVWYHRVGEPQSADSLVHDDPAQTRHFYFVHSTESERFVVLSVVSYGEQVESTEVWLLDAKAGQVDFAPATPKIDGEVWVLDAEERELLCRTTQGAPNGRVVAIDPSCPEERNWREVINERKQPLEQVVAVGDKLVAVYRQDATHRIQVFDRRGHPEYEIGLPEPGLVRLVPGERCYQDLLWSFASFTQPPTLFRHDLETRRSAVLMRTKPPFDARRYRTTRVFFPAKDGVQIPMFLVHRSDLVRNSRHPLLLYGYGGNGHSLGPAFDPMLFALLERGFVFAVPCLRGGGEYGEAWHEAGRRERKQTVFDDCVAATEWLHANGYSTPDRTAVTGASNGGLLVGAVMTQRPDLFAVALPAFAILDMLRFHQFTLGHVWISEYGVSNDPEMFPHLLAYSPVHNIVAGVRYPATLVLTSEHDYRVVPAHSFKFIATLQARGVGPGPYLIRIDRDSGHGAVSLPKEMEERADVYAFVLAHLTALPSAPILD